MDPAVKPAANPDTAETTPNLIKSAGAQDTILSQATDAEKQAQEAENQRLLDADETTLSEEEKGKRNILVKAQEDKKLLETPDDQLSEDQKAKKAVLVQAEADKAKAAQVPEKYEFEVPEGMTLNQALADKISPVLKELKITQEGAQKIVNVYAEHIKAEADAQAENFKQFVQSSYDETVKALGPTSKEQLAYVAKVRDRFLSDETQEMLDASGLSNHKALIFDLIKIGKLISEDKSAAGVSEVPAGAKSAAEIMYPKHPK